MTTCLNRVTNTLKSLQMPETKLCLIQHGQWVTKNVFQHLLLANLKYLSRCHLKKFLYMCFKKLVFCELCNSQPFLEGMIYMVRTTIKLCTSFKKQLRIWIGTQRAKRANVLISPDSHHSVVLYTNVLTSNISSDTTEVLNHTSAFG